MTDFADKIDKIAIPFWIILIIYSVYEISRDNQGAWLILVIITTALVLDSISIIKSNKKKK